MGRNLYRRTWFKLLYLVIVVLFAISGCVYEGPQATPEEVFAYQRDLAARALRYRVSLLKRVLSVGYKLTTAIPKKFYRGDFSYLGLVILDNSDDVQAAYGLPEGKFPVVCSTVEGTFAENLDVIPGSILLKINGRSVYSYSDVKEVVNYFPPNTFVELTLWKNGEYSRMVRLNWRPVDIDFYMSADAEINAMATPNSIIVTYGMMRFIQNDDELAVVLGHELAHIMLSHHAKGQGVNIVAGLLGAVIGAKLDEVLPGVGGQVANMGTAAVESGFSRDLERQADYWGLYFAYRAGYDIEAGKDIWERFAIEVPQSMIKSFWATHPTSIERRVYIDKIVKEFKKGNFPDNGN